MRQIALAGLLALGACNLLPDGNGTARREAEIACYERMLTIGPGSTGASLDGCSEGQRGQHAGLVREATAIIELIAALRPPSEAAPPADLPPQERLARSLKALHEQERYSELRTNQGFQELMDRIERFERRRAVIREELARMRESR